VKALLVEDEAVAARALQRMLADVAPGLEVVAVLATVRDTVAWLTANARPDLIFLDIQLADGLSFEIFDLVQPQVPVIFTTAHDAFALRAFDVFGIDYLLKPIDPARLARALAKASQLGATVAAGSAQLARHFHAAGRYKQRFLVQSGGSLHSIDIANIAYFVKELVVRLVTRQGRGYALGQSLDELQQALDPERFFRLNRQVLAQVDAVQRVHRRHKGKLEVDLLPPAAVPVLVSQERASEFRAWLDR
jgi:two-component system LytT family response regulator